MTALCIRQYRFVLVALFNSIVVALPVAFLVSGCQTRQRVFQDEFRAGGPVTIAPAGSSAQVSQNCLNGNYIYVYKVSDGVHAGDAWLCCIPINELLRVSFRCGGIQRPAHLGSAADQKVQTCSLINPTSPRVEYIPACIPAPLKASGT